MSLSRSCGRLAWVMLIVIGLTPSISLGQINEPWVVFLDYETDSECGVINAANAELILLESGWLAIVSGADVILGDTFVNEYDEVFYADTPAGFIEFLTDGDGYRSVFWTTLAGTLVEVDTFSGEPFDSELMPADRINTGCDACDFIDGSPYCPDEIVDWSDDIVDWADDVVVLPNVFCGAGAPGAVGIATLLLPLLGWRNKRP